jgi:alginate O-acetyltransferase complex protein AlgJ
MTLPPLRPGALTRRAFGAAAASLLVAASFAAPAQAQNTVIIGKGGWLFPGWESLTTLDKPGIDKVVGLIADTKAALAGRNIALIVPVVPLKARSYAANLPDGTRLSPEIEGQYDYILGQLRQAGIETLDLRPALKSVETGKQTAFYRADYHWTAWAAEAAADAVGQLIKQKFPRLGGQPGTGDKLGQWITQRNLGDLAQRFLTPEQQRQVGPDLFTVRASGQSGGGLLGSGPAPVHVVGNSFVQPYLGFPQKLSSVIDRPVSLTWQPGNVGPYATLLQFLATPDFQRAPPQIVIWQFNEGPFHSGPESPDQWDTASLMSPQTFRDRMQQGVRR